MDKYQKSIDDFPIPEDFSAECTVLNELVNDESFLSMSVGVLQGEYFYRPECRKIYDTIRQMSDNGEKVDIVTITPRVERDFFIKHIMGREATINPEAFLQHCYALKAVAQRRRLYFACVKGIQMSERPDVSEGELLEMPSKLAEEMLKGASKESTQSIEEVIIEIGDTIGKEAETRVPTSFHGLDRLLYGGFGRGNLIVLAARPSVGKTSFMLQMARCAASRGIPTLALSLEMTNEELGQRLLFGTQYVNAGEFMRGDVNMDGFEKAAYEYHGKPLYLDESPQTLDEVCSTIRVNVQRGKCKIAFIDYLQLMSSSDRMDSLYRQVTEMTKRLKKLAKNLKIPIVVLCQLNRNSVAENRSPQLHDLRDSGSIEQDADVVLMLERPKGEDGQLGNIVKMYVRKNRGGLAGDIVLTLESDKSYTNFTEIE